VTEQLVLLREKMVDAEDEAILCLDLEGLAFVAEELGIVSVKKRDCQR
jgi:hypothetical protein